MGHLLLATSERPRRRARAARLAPIGAAAALLSLGCVTTAEYDRVVAERDELTQRMEAQTESFSAERQALADEVEALRTERDGLAGEARDLRAAHDELGAKARQYDAIQPTYEGLLRDLEADLAAARIEIDQLREGLRMSLPAEVLFESGAAELTEEGRTVVARIAGTLRDAPYEVRVEGHTDGVAIRGALAERFPTNWELAGARAASVVRALEESGVDPARLAAVSRGPNQPIAENDTPEGRARNRRIELRLIPLPGTKPGAAPPGFDAPGGAEPAPPAAGDGVAR